MEESRKRRRNRRDLISSEEAGSEGRVPSVRRRFGISSRRQRRISKNSPKNWENRIKIYEYVNYVQRLCKSKPYGYCSLYIKKRKKGLIQKIQKHYLNPYIIFVGVFKSHDTSVKFVL